jgi:D-proline reductase (dithiol) PrdB
MGRFALVHPSCLQQMPVQIARACVPYTPFKKKLEESRVALVTTAGVYAEGMEPFTDNDLSFRMIPQGVEPASLKVVPGHYDPASAEADINCVFPVERLAELLSAGKIGKIADYHVSMGLATALRKLKEETSWEIADKVARMRPDVVILTGG